MDRDDVSEFPHLPKRVEVIDCTLRDGEQAPGVWFSVEEKLELAAALSRAGINLLDAGFPAAADSDKEVMQELRARGTSARLGATARPLASDIAAAEEARAHEVFMFMPTSDFRLSQTLGVTRAQAASMFVRGAEEVAARGMGLNLVFEDASRAALETLVEFANLVHQRVPVLRLVLCDTVGCSLPSRMQRLVDALRKQLDSTISVCPHCHNDFGMAVANTLAAVTGGARAVTCTVNGIGERAGNADLAETVAAFSHLLGIEHTVEPTHLVELQRTVERISGIHQSPTKPVTGTNVFRHESGIHVDGMLKNALSYEFLPAAWVGRESEFVLGKHSGTSLIRHFLEQTGRPCSPEKASSLLRAVKWATEQRDKAEHYRAFQVKEAFAGYALSGISPSLLLDEPFELAVDTGKVRVARGTDQVGAPATNRGQVRGQDAQR
jgi:isopropylmalate/homocitrate/citramalate synthase